MSRSVFETVDAWLNGSANLWLRHSIELEKLEFADRFEKTTPERNLVLFYLSVYMSLPSRVLQLTDQSVRPAPPPLSIKRNSYELDYDLNEDGEVVCGDPRGHSWVVSDDDENYCYCERCGCCEY